MQPKSFRRAFLTLALAAVAAVGALSRISPVTVKASVPSIRAVGPVLMTVSDIDRSVDFYSRILSFEKVSEVELAGEQVEHLFGVFGARVRIVRMQLGDESIELAQFLAPRGGPIPVDSRSNDLWFQHIAIIVSDTDRAYQLLRQIRWNTPPLVHSGCQIGTRMPAGFKRSSLKIRMNIPSRSCSSRKAKAIPNGTARATIFF